MTGQLSLLLDEPAQPPQPGQPRRYGRLQFSDTPDNFAAELAAIVADEKRLTHLGPVKP